MKNGDVHEFINGLHYGDERFFIYNGDKYFIQGYFFESMPMLEVYIIETDIKNFEWRAISENNNYPVEEFENAKIFNGKSFWEVEQDIEWVDC